MEKSKGKNFKGGLLKLSRTHDMTLLHKLMLGYIALAVIPVLLITVTITFLFRARSEIRSTTLWIKMRSRMK